MAQVEGGDCQSASPQEAGEDQQGTMSHVEAWYVRHNVRLDQDDIRVMFSDKVPDLLSGQLARDALVLCQQECAFVWCIFVHDDPPSTTNYEIVADRCSRGRLTVVADN